MRQRRTGTRAGVSAGEQFALDDLCREVVMVRAGAARVDLERPNGSGFLTAWWGKCERCGREGWLQWAHFFTRARWRTRWDPDNSFGFCSGCHWRVDGLEPRHRQRESWFVSWVRERIGVERFEALCMRFETGRDRVDPMAWRVTLERERARLLSGEA